MYIVLDIDSTLANNKHREHLLQKRPKDWEAFHDPALVIKDEVIEGVDRVLRHFKELKHTFVALTGRHERLRDTTMRWLHERLPIDIPDSHLLMRPDGNMLSNAESKRQLILEFKTALNDRNAEFLFIEDDAKTRDTLKDLGIVLQAPECWALLFPDVVEKKKED